VKTWPSPVEWSEPFSLAFHRQAGSYHHVFRRSRVLIRDSITGGLYETAVESLALAPRIMLFRFAKPEIGMLVRVDAIVDFASRTALVVHQSLRDSVSAVPRITVERASVGTTPAMEALVLYPTWERHQGELELQGKNKILRLRILPHGRLASPNRGRLIEVGANAVLALIEGPRLTSAALIDFGEERFGSSSVLRIDGLPSYERSEGGAVFTPADY
jgi:hypothetical protein